MLNMRMKKMKSSLAAAGSAAIAIYERIYTLREKQSRRWTVPKTWCADGTRHGCQSRLITPYIVVGGDEYRMHLVSHDALRKLAYQA